MMRILGLIPILFLCACNLVRSDSIAPANPLTVQFLQPLPDVIFIEGEEVTIELLAQDAAGAGVARVALQVDSLFHLDGAPQTGSAEPIFTVQMNWLAAGAGFHALTAIAYRADGSTSAPTTLRIRVESALSQAGTTDVR